MPRSSSLSLFAALAIACTAAPAVAQFSSVKSAMERVRSVRGDIDSSKARADLIPVGKALIELGETIRSSAADVGRNFAEANGAYSSERGQIRERARALVREAENLKKQAINWVATLEGTNDPDSMTRESRGTVDIVISAWETLVRETEDRRRWLDSGLAQAKELRENVAKPGSLLERAEEEAAAAKKEADEAIKRSFSDWMGAKSDLYDAESRRIRAYQEWYDAQNSPGASEFSDKMKRLAGAWQDCNEKVVDAAKRDWDLFKGHEGLIAEHRRVAERYIGTIMDLRRFLKDIQDNGANKSWQEFTIWKELFEAEFGR